MKILQVNTFLKGGAANACIGLHSALISKGIDSRLLTLYSSSHSVPQVSVYQDMIDVLRRPLLTKVKDKILAKRKQQQEAQKREFLTKVSQEADYFSFVKTPYNITRLDIFQEADIVNLHWVADFLDWPSFFSATNRKKIVWTLHDMHPFTGGYHYAGNYKGYQHNDHRYPPAQGTHLPDVAEQNLRAKKAVLRRFDSQFHVVTPSKWLSEVSQSSALFKNYPHYVIPNSVDTTLFRPLEKLFCRDLLGLPSDKTILLFVSHDVKKRRKGFKILLDSLPLLANQNLLVCSVGHMPEPMDTGPVQHIPLRSIQDPRMMAVAYNAADAFVIPTLEDNLPNTVLESIACATPVVGFSTGGVQDMIRDGFNGYITERKTSSGLVEVIQRFMNSNEKLDYEAIRRDAVERYSPTVQANAYTKLYQSILT